MNLRLREVETRINQNEARSNATVNDQDEEASDANNEEGNERPHGEEIWRREARDGRREPRNNRPPHMQ